MTKLVAAVEHIVKGIVQYPDDVRVAARSSARGQVLDVTVNPKDLGRVIGRNGKTAKAIRTVIDSLATDESVRVNIVDVDS